LSIDESSFFNGELYTIITDKAAKKNYATGMIVRAKTVTAVLERKLLSN
jgi:hypothetical protein